MIDGTRTLGAEDEQGRGPLAGWPLAAFILLVAMVGGLWLEARLDAPAWAKAGTAGLPLLAVIVAPVVWAVRQPRGEPTRRWLLVVWVVIVGQLAIGLGARLTETSPSGTPSPIRLPSLR